MDEVENTETQQQRYVPLVQVGATPTIEGDAGDKHLFYPEVHIPGLGKVRLWISRMPDDVYNDDEEATILKGGKLSKPTTPQEAMRNGFYDLALDIHTPPNIKSQGRGFLSIDGQSDMLFADIPSGYDEEKHKNFIGRFKDNKGRYIFVENNPAELSKLGFRFEFKSQGGDN